MHVQQAGRTNYGGLVAAGRAFFVLEKMAGDGTCVVVTSDEEVSYWQDNLTALMQFFGEIPVHVFLGSDHFGRLNTLKSISAHPRAVIVTTKDSLAQKTISRGSFSGEILELDPGRDYEFNRLLEVLGRLGYQRVDFVEEKGQFSRRGEVLDLWPPDQNLPWRLVFSINTLESLRSFDYVTQRSQETLRHAQLIPVKEDTEVYLNEYLPDNTVFFLDSAADEDLPEAFHPYDWMINDPLAPDTVDAGFKGYASLAGNQEIFISELRKASEGEYRTAIFCQNQGEKERLEDILHDHHWTGVLPEVYLGPLAEGFYSAERKLAVFSCHEILFQRRRVSFPKFKTGRRLEGLWEIAAGDFVVHERYGIGRYLGLRKVVRGDQESEYLCIEYKGGDKLYVPPDDFRVVQKYVGVEGFRPKLYSLDTGAWERAKQRAKKGAEELAAELLKLYAERKNAPGHAFAPDNHWERELADSFPYQETEDQAKAIEEVKRDLEQPRPMERVVCGDVGFGKTEVAIRAAFKVAQDSRQVAVLVPTTVLAEQHYNTFCSRLAAFPVRLALLSRFQTKKEQDKVVADLNAGLVDIVVGTHRLLSKDVKFKDLGLLIIDEEHRFGVKQKEKIKGMKKDVDVLLLSATPIPRTLSLALSNLRDLSVIETPPFGRLPIETHLGPYDENIVKKIIEAELSRNGQVYYVYNRVETIVSRALYLKKLIPSIRWGIVHGQMPAQEIEKTMWLFLHKQIDVLIATTIIESGLDIPSVNTMIIEEAENFGLAQLYQLRGRIGRERQKAYCYLFYTKELLTEDSRKRLEALQEFSELGAGFRLALRDLEIRGAGNILSGRQHGFVQDIGFELYSKLLDEASSRLRGQAAESQEWKTTMEFSLPAHLPDEYVQSEDLRILFYRRLSVARSDQELEMIHDELQDRFGTLPGAAENLFRVAELRIPAEKLKIKSIVEEEQSVALYFSPEMNFTPEKILAMARDFAGVLEFMRGEVSGIRLRKGGFGMPVFEYLKRFLGAMKRYVQVG